MKWTSAIALITLTLVQVVLADIATTINDQQSALSISPLLDNTHM
jgi:hypothetical protein